MKTKKNLILSYLALGLSLKRNNKVFSNKVYSTAFFSLWLFSVNVYSQKAQLPDNYTTNATLAEKIYLQTDRKTYSIGDTIWFKCVVASAFDHCPTTISKILYADLIGPSGKIEQTKIIKLENGTGSGFFGLKKGASDGRCLLRAYTQWNINFDGDFSYNQYVNVFSEKNKIEGTPINGISVLKKSNGSQTINALLDPLLIDSLHVKNLNVRLSNGRLTDSLKIVKNKNGKYTLTYDLPDTSRMVSLYMSTANKKVYSMSVQLDPDYINLRFFPEGGELVHGLPARVGFKSVDPNGKGISLSGDIIDNNNNFITKFSGNNLGMGSFEIENVDSLSTYYARLVSKHDTCQLLLVPLPRVAPVGNSIRVESDENWIYFAALSNYMLKDKASIMVSCRGIVYLNHAFVMEDGSFGGKIPVGDLPDGIIAFTLIDGSGQPVAERLFFNNKNGSRLNIDVVPDMVSYDKRSLTTLEIRATNSKGEAANASVSVLAINKDLLGDMQSTGNNILSYFLLSSEIKGEIENPGYYFSQGLTCNYDIDVLMLTQGWARYLYSKPYNNLPFSPERNLSIHGNVKGGFFKEKGKAAKLTMMTFGKGLQAGSTFADSTGRFSFDLDDEYGDEIDVVIQSAKKSGKKINYTVNLNKRAIPSVPYSVKTNVFLPDSIEKELVKKDVERIKVERAIKISSGEILLEELEVKDYKRSANSKRIIEVCGSPDEIINGKELLEREEKWSFGLYNVLMYYDGSINIDLPDVEGDFMAYVSGSDLTIILVDGEYDRLNQDLIASLPTSSVSSIDIFKCAKGFELIYVDKVGSLPSTVLCGSIININTYAGKGVLASYMTPVGINKFRIPVFSTPKEFYTPNYTTINNDERNKHPDLRQVISWKPLLKTNDRGMISTSYYNSDIVGNIMVLVEAISDKGELGYKVAEYKVTGQKPNIYLLE